MAAILTTLVQNLVAIDAAPTTEGQRAAQLLQWLQQGNFDRLKALLLQDLAPAPVPSGAPLVKTKVAARWGDFFAHQTPMLEKIFATLDALPVEGKCGCRYVPLRDNVFRAFHLTPLATIKVVIVGQDPYHTIRKGHPVADGLAFSTAPSLPIQPSLRVIFDELKREYGEAYRYPTNGSLEGWANQGVLLLNASLTTLPGRAGAHTTLWKPVTQAALITVATARPQSIFVLWGAKAQELKAFLPPGTLTLVAAHPAAYDGFLGNNHFKIINAYLTGRGEAPIDWQT